MKLFNFFSKSVHKLNLNGYLHSRVLLYVLCLLSIINLVLLANKQKYRLVSVFLTIGLLMYFINKNMVVVLSTALIATCLINFYWNRKEGVDETLEEKDEKNDGKNDEKNDEENDEEKDEDEVVEKKEKKNIGSSERTKLYNDLTKDFKDFQEVQQQLLNTMKDIDPLLSKAEGFVSKFEGYKEKAAKMGK